MSTRAEALNHLFRSFAQEATHAIAAGEVERPLNLPELAPVRRAPLIRQLKPNECGLACLAMIAGYHGISADLPALRRLCTLSSNGATLKALMETAGRIGLGTRALRGASGHLGHVSLPAILHWNGNHFVVLASVGRTQLGGGSFHIQDPARGTRTIGEAELSRRFTGAILELTKIKKFSAEFSAAPAEGSGGIT